MFNKKGSALMQVLLVTVLVATIATAMLRIAVSRTATAANNTRAVSAKNILEACNAQVQSCLVRGGTNCLEPCKIQVGGPGEVITVNITPADITESGVNGISYRQLTFRIAENDLSKL